MRIETEDGILNPVIEDDPRVHGGMYAVLRKAAAADPRAEIIGIDQRRLPVVLARMGGSLTQSTFAIWPKGKPDRPEMPLVEEWVMEDWGED